MTLTMRRIDKNSANYKAGGSGETELPRVTRLLAILGKDVLLLPWPIGTKGAGKAWGHLTVAAMGSLAHLRALESGNIGVALGEVSNHLCSIDLDSDEWMGRFLADNPLLVKSLRTRGARGGNVWVRIIGAYPRPHVLKTLPSSGKPKGEKVGEWRATGTQTIIDGIHPDGGAYSFTVEAKPVEIAFTEIVWPDGLQGRHEKPKLPVEHSNTVTQYLSNAVAQETQVGSSPFGSFDVLPFVPTKRGQSNGLLFEMAGRLLTWQKRERQISMLTDKTNIFGKWWHEAKPHLDPAEDYYAYFSKWIGACAHRKFSDDETPLTAAWREVQENAMPPEALLEREVPMQTEMRKLIALCHHLQKGQGTEPFFLTSRDAGKLLEVPHTTVFRWIEILVEETGPFRILMKGRIGSLKDRRANEYVYLPLLRLPNETEK